MRIDLKKLLCAFCVILALGFIAMLWAHRRLILAAIRGEELPAPPAHHPHCCTDKS
jgi:hypothetical protein